jgi:hypothetical protein
VNVSAGGMTNQQLKLKEYALFVDEDVLIQCNDQQRLLIPVKNNQNIIQGDAGVSRDRMGQVILSVRG